MIFELIYINLNCFMGLKREQASKQKINSLEPNYVVKEKLYHIIKL